MCLDVNFVFVLLEETYKWRKITAAGYTACIALGIYTFATEEHHEQHEKPVCFSNKCFVQNKCLVTYYLFHSLEKLFHQVCFLQEYSYLRIRNKEFPWGE